MLLFLRPRKDCPMLSFERQWCRDKGSQNMTREQRIDRIIARIDAAEADMRECAESIKRGLMPATSRAVYAMREATRDRNMRALRALTCDACAEFSEDDSRVTRFRQFEGAPSAHTCRR
jgi:hypothetical protein